MTTSRRRVLLLGFIAAGLLTACGDDGADAEPSASGATKRIEITADEYSFSGDPGVSIVAGDTIQFVVANVGELIHEMQVLDSDGKLLDRTDRIQPGGRDDVVVEFDEPGTYQVICDIDDHLSRGQRSQFQVGES